MKFRDPLNTVIEKFLGIVSESSFFLKKLESKQAVSEMWDNQSGEGQLEELYTEIDMDQDWESRS